MDESSFQNVTANRKVLPERVAQQIIDLIISRNLKSGDKLPNEFELGALLNVGRGTVREAIKLLVARNVLIIERGKGTFISKHPGMVDDPFGFAFFDDKLKLAFDLWDVRMQLEPWVAALAAQRAGDADIEEIKARCIQVENDILAGINHLPDDVEFHVSIAKSTNNVVIPNLIPVILCSVGLFGELNNNALRSETIITHHAILDAITAHDPEAAHIAMVDHLNQNKASLDALRKKGNDTKEACETT
jgi:DNA-binding FadR family transcriptional regulator